MRRMMWFATEFFQIISAQQDRSGIGCACQGRGCDLPVSEAVKPSGEADKAITAWTTRRIRGLLRSIPPTLVLPTCSMCPPIFEQQVAANSIW